MQLPKPYSTFYNEIAAVVPEKNLITDPLRTLTYGTDASFYRLVPKIVVNVRSEDEVVAILKSAAKHKISVTFRAAGTSLSGQSVTDSVLVRLGEGWLGYRIFERAERITLEPGIIGSHANRVLLPFGKKIGPDPASIDTCKIGGILANNASGMCCGVAENSYKTLHDSRLVFADGEILDTADDVSRKTFAARRPDLLKGVVDLRGRVLATPGLADRIRHKFKIKNTTGYSLNALVDFEDPYEIIQHLMVGSEGTLGFISNVTYRTVVEHKHKASALIFFPDTETACEATMTLKRQPVSAVELMDRASLASVEGKPGMPKELVGLAPGVTALLVETRSESAKGLAQQIATITKSIDGLNKVFPVAFTDKVEEYSKLWLVRKGLFPAVGAVRETGTTVIIEDVAFPIEDLAKATLELQALFAKHGYTEAIIFGHALEGNLHFVFTQDFSDDSEVRRYENFMAEVCEMVVGGYDGSLKAEHGTGRNMAPFVEKEWGAEAYQLMKDIKSLFDPDNLLNPGVIINDDPQAHLKNLKPLPPAHEIVDKCIECGFCEPICPSRDLTFTPRHRIVGWREISRLRADEPASSNIPEYLKGYAYQGNETCAADGLCATRCPVGINTGKFIKHLRADEVTPRRDKAAQWVADNFAKTTRMIRAGLRTAEVLHFGLGDAVMHWGSDMLRTVSGGASPSWSGALPHAAPQLKPCVQCGSGTPVVYFPSCITRTFGAAEDDAELLPLPTVTVRLLKKAGFRVIMPENPDNYCCGMPFSSKGYDRQAEQKGAELESLLLELSEGGEYPVLCDTSPCVFHMKETYDKRLHIYEPAEFLLEHAAERLEFTPVEERIAIHSTCSTIKMGLVNTFQRLAQMCAKEVVVPEDIACCGFAGDRGFTKPELNASALSTLKGKVAGCACGYSSSRTCEIGLALHGEIPYRSIIHLVDRCTTPRRPEQSLGPSGEHIAESLTI